MTGGIEDEETWTEVSLPPDARAAGARESWSLIHVFDGAERRATREVWIAKEGAKIGRQSQWGDDLKVNDPRISRHHATVKRVRGAFVLDVTGKSGVRKNGRIATGEVTLADNDVLRVGDSLFVARRGKRPPEGDVEGELTGIAPDIVELRHAITRIGPTGTTVLVLGETGVGKELVARSVHEASTRQGAFVAVNCGAIPGQLAEAQLFGHAAGAFTGATRSHPGHFRDAEKGTLFLDEIGELPLALQPTLLRALDQGEVLGVGERTVTKVDVRVVAATNRDLYEEVQAGRFRKDLYARLSEITLRVPTLRDRREDIAGLFFDALTKAPEAVGLIGASTVEQLLLYRWPFNVREVVKLASHVGVRAADEADLAKRIVFEHLERHAEETGARPAPPPASAAEGPQTDAAPAPTEGELRALLEAHQGNVSAVARAVGRSRTQVYRWMERYGFNSENFR